jgi:hypothetical protein
LPIAIEQLVEPPQVAAFAKNANDYDRLDGRIEDQLVAADASDPQFRVT